MKRRNKRKYTLNDKEVGKTTFFQQINALEDTLHESSLREHPVDVEAGDVFDCSVNVEVDDVFDCSGEERIDCTSALHEELWTPVRKGGKCTKAHMYLAIAHLMYKYKWTQSMTTSVLLLLALFTDNNYDFPTNYNSFKKVCCFGKILKFEYRILIF